MKICLPTNRVNFPYLGVSPKWVAMKLSTANDHDDSQITAQLLRWMIFFYAYSDTVDFGYPYWLLLVYT